MKKKKQRFKKKRRSTHGNGSILQSLHRILRRATVAFVLVLAVGMICMIELPDQPVVKKVYSGLSDLSTRLFGEMAIDLSTIPEFDGEPYVVLNQNQPDFTDEELTTEAMESYSSLDWLGRCGTAEANVCRELMPTQERQDISDVEPTGWVNHQYEFIDQYYLYNRCHLIGFQLTGENDNEKNLITGTRYLNVEGMLPFENEVAEYIYATDNHVRYRVTPIFEGANLVASGVEMEAESVEDDGDGISFHVYVYNVQPGVEIDYLTGENWEAS